MPPQCGCGSSPIVRPYTLLCIYKSSRQASILPCGMWQTGHTVRQLGRAKQKAAVRAEPNKRLEC